MHWKSTIQFNVAIGWLALGPTLTAADSSPPAQPGNANSTPAAPRFSVQYMDRSVEPGSDFYRFAAGKWLTNNPVPADKSRWSGFEELQERNWRLIRDILESAAADNSSPAKAPRRAGGWSGRTDLTRHGI